MGKENNGKRSTLPADLRTKAMWTVCAGVVPYHPRPEYTKIWVYTVQDFENDKNVPPEEVTRFSEIVEEVSNYQWVLSNPGEFNWVHSDFIWI